MEDEGGRYFVYRALLLPFALFHASVYLDALRQNGGETLVLQVDRHFREGFGHLFEKDVYVGLGIRNLVLVGEYVSF